MEFMTEEYVKEQAKKGVIPALECSLAHHKEGATADWVELRDAIEDKKFDLGELFCACCLYRNEAKNRCEQCLLGKNWCKGEMWQDTSTALASLKNDYSNANFRAFQEAASKVCDYIEAVLDKERAKECECSKKSKPELRHGDIRQWGDTGVCGVIDMSEVNRMHVIWKDGDRRVNWPTEHDVLKRTTHIGTLREVFADFKRNSEDLKEFETTDINKDIKCWFENGFVKIKTADGDGRMYFKYNKATEFHQKLGRLIATARRAEAKK